MKRIILLITTALSLFSPALGNPFKVDFPNKQNLTNEDYLYIQTELHKIDILPDIKKIYQFAGTSLEDYHRRISKGITQILIDPDNNAFPMMDLVKVGEGGSRCIVTCVPFNVPYPTFVRTQLRELKKVGFNGYYFYQVGGFPNPTGEEIQYAGVPYCFKIFMMLEAKKKGFNHVLWLDSGMIPLKNPWPLFDIIERTGAFIHSPSVKTHYHSRFILPKTLERIKNLTGIDALTKNYVCTVAFGLKMDDERCRRLIEEYYEVVRDGLSFFSCFPEEFVLTALIHKHGNWNAQLSQSLAGQDLLESRDSPSQIEQIRSKGFYFFLRTRKSHVEGLDE